MCQKKKGLDVEVPINKEWARHDLSTSVVVRPEIRQNRRQ